MAPESEGDLDAAVDAVLLASRALVAVAARSIAVVESSADVIEVRVLVVLASREAASLREVADALGLHVSTASRLCDRMVARGLLDRRDDPADRRQLELRLTADGTRVLSRMRTERRRDVKRILARMSTPDRDRLAETFDAFSTAAGDASERDLWAIGWPH